MRGVYLENVWTAFSENVAAVRVQHTSAGGREFRARRTESTRQTIDAGLPDAIPARPARRRGRPHRRCSLPRRCSSSSSSASVTPPPKAAAMATRLVHLLVDSEVGAAERSTP